MEQIYSTFLLIFACRIPRQLLHIQSIISQVKVYLTKFQTPFSRKLNFERCIFFFCFDLFFHIQSHRIVLLLSLYSSIVYKVMRIKFKTLKVDSIFQIEETGRNKHVSKN